MNNYKNLSAPIFNIQTYCIHDGPGIRTTVFVKGCPLHCLWCANPESNASKPQLFTYSNKCTGCGACVKICPQKAVEIKQVNAKWISVTNRNLCTACGICETICPTSAREIAGKQMSVQDCLSAVLQDKLFLTGSDGGMTISGGEVLMHPEFSAALLQACRENGIHTAVESSSFGTRKAVDMIYQHVDLALLDIKHMDSEIHRQLTGVTNEIILDNIRHIYHDLHVPVRIRIPVIPGYNDDFEQLGKAAEFIAKELGKDVIVHLLPYHRLGLSKAESLGQNSLDNIPVPDDDFMQERKQFIETFGLESKIGG